MKNRYITNIKALEHLGLEGENAVDKMASTDIINHEILTFPVLGQVSLSLTADEAAELTEAGFNLIKSEVKEAGLLGNDYEKVRSYWIKNPKKLISGKGVKVAVLDSGLDVTAVPVEHTINLATAQPGVGNNPNHGTNTTSIIKSTQIGMAQDVELFFVKVLNDSSMSTSEVMVAAIEYCITNDIDVVNMSFFFNDTALMNAILAAQSQNIVFCASSGNAAFGGDQPVMFPAALNGVVSVNAVTEAGTFIYQNVIPYTLNGLFLGHRPDVACSGSGTQAVYPGGTVGTVFGTSFSAPFFVATFALYKESLQESNNYTVLNHIYSKLKKPAPSDAVYFGRGTVSF